MAQSMYLTDCRLITLPKKNVRLPRRRFVRYYQDLYHFHKLTLDPSSFVEGSQYCYVDLCDAAMSHYLAPQALSHVSAIVVSTWAHEFDPDYCSVSGYLNHRYRLLGDVIDVCDRGTISALTGMRLIADLLKCSPDQNVIMLVLDLTSTPRSCDSTYLPPQHDAVFSMLMTTAPEATGTTYQVVESGELRIVSSSVLCQLCARLTINPDDVLVIAKSDFQRDILFDFNIYPVSPSVGCVPVLSKLILNYSKQYLLLIDKDVESDDIGYVFVRRD